MKLDNRQSDNEALLAQAMPTIRSIAREVHAQHPPVRNLVPYEDLVSEGVVGALRVAETYDPSRGSFSNFARKSIHGQMVEMHRRGKMEQNIMLGSSRMSYEEASVSHAALLSDTRNRPDETLQAKEYQSILSDAVGSLPEREATVLQRIFYDDDHLKDIARTLAVCPSRVSQIKYDALSEMRAALAERGIEDDGTTKGSALPTRLM